MGELARVTEEFRPQEESLTRHCLIQLVHCDENRSKDGNSTSFRGLKGNFGPYSRRFRVFLRQTITLDLRIFRSNNRFGPARDAFDA